MAERLLRHFFLDQAGITLDYTSKLSGGGKRNYPERERYEHGRMLQQKLKDAWLHAKLINEQQKAVSLPVKEGIYLDFESKPEFELATKSLEARRSGIRLLNIRTEYVNDFPVRKATVFIPAGKENYYLNKVEAYLTEETKKHKNPKNQDLVTSMQDIKLAVLESFWRGKKDWIPGEAAQWCEIWLSSDSEKVEEQFRELAGIKLQIALQPESLKFPERRVILGKANRTQLQELIVASPHIAEFRRASETADFFVEMENKEQTEWAQELLERTQFDDNSNVCICILDTGINNGHILLKRILDDHDCQSYISAWGTHDHDSHGTRMAG